MFPASPVLVLTMEASGFSSLAGPALRFLGALPPGIRVDARRIPVDLAERSSRPAGLGGYLEYVRGTSEINTVEGACSSFVPRLDQALIGLGPDFASRRRRCAEESAAA